MELFGTAGVRGPVTDEVTPELAMRVATAVGHHASQQGDTTIVVGRDGRTTGEGLAAAVTAGLVAAGMTVERVGQVPTPAVAYASQGRRGLMLTASHNPPTDNGIKLFVDGEEYGRAAEKAIERAVETDHGPLDWNEWGRSRRETVLDDYRTAVTDYARRVIRWNEQPAETGDDTPAAGDDAQATEDTPATGDDAPIGAGDDTPAAGLRVAVDTGNGMAGVVTPTVLTRLGASVVTLNGNVDGRFPGRESKPTAESLAEFRAFVAADEADVGIAHDGDADRIVVTDADGAIVHEDTVVAVLAEAYTRATARQTTDGEPVVVTTPNASGRIDERVEAAGGRVDRTALGYLHDGIDSVRTAGDRVAFAAEPWKHVHPAFGPWIDGVASAAVLACLVARDGLATLREPVTERPYRKQSLPCADDRKADAMDRVGDRLPAAFPNATVETTHGVRLAFDNSSWVLVRPSGTEPYLRVYAESDDVDELIEAASEVVETAIEN